MKPLIPLRPNKFVTPLTQAEQATLTWYVLSGCTRKEAFLTFARPDMLASKAKAAVEDYIKQFYARKEVKEYIDAYQQTLDEFLHPAPEETQSEMSLEERKAAARQKAMDFAIELANNIQMADDPEFVMKLLDKVGILGGDEQVDEAPRRYLPVSPCQTGCAYRMFCEQNTEDMCQYCKYHKFGEENGIHYDKTQILEYFGTEVAKESEQNN